jgi:hypothetical protein
MAALRSIERALEGSVADSWIGGDMRIKMWKFAVAALVIVLFAAWYAFRPEGRNVTRPNLHRSDAVEALESVRSPVVLG